MVSVVNLKVSNNPDWILNLYICAHCARVAQRSRNPRVQTYVGVFTQRQKAGITPLWHFYTSSAMGLKIHFTRVKEMENILSLSGHVSKCRGEHINRGIEEQRNRIQPMKLSHRLRRISHLLKPVPPFYYRGTFIRCHGNILVKKKQENCRSCKFLRKQASKMLILRARGIRTIRSMHC